MRFVVATALGLLVAMPVSAQQSEPMQVQRIAPVADNVATLPANTEVFLRLNEELTTKGNSMEEGSTFFLTVASDVMLGEYVVIPEGARATGRVTWMTDKGMFGKSGKFEIEITHVEVGGRRIPLNGTFRQEGEGNTVATVGAVVVVPVAGFFVTGRSGRMPAGTELTAFTEDDLDVQFDGPPPVQDSPMAVSRTSQPDVAAEAAEPVAEEVAEAEAEAATDSDADAEASTDAVPTEEAE